MKIIDKATRADNEVLRVNINKMKESQYLDRTMKRLNAELSPFRDKSSFDEDYIRAMWTNYTRLVHLRDGSTPKQIANDLPRVAALVKEAEEGPLHKDTRTLNEWAAGNLHEDDKRVRDYYI